MNALLKTTAVVGGMAVAVVVAALPATASTGSSLSSNNTCANPVLAQDASGWAVSRGGSGRRVAITGHTAAHYAFRVTASSSTVVVTLPPQAVIVGKKWTFAADSQISGGGNVAVSVDFYSASAERLTHSTGSKTSASATSWSRASVSATPPSGAVRAKVSQTATLNKGALWSSTACNYIPPNGSSVPTTTPTTTTTAPPTGTTTPPSPPSGDGTQAATVLGWGTPTDGDEFNGNAIDTTKWGVYDSPGHDGKGLRRPSQITVANGVMTISGTAKGTTGGMEFLKGRLFGRWETRMRVPHGDSRYHPVLILWPDKEDWPKGGEVDYAETTATAADVDFFLHYKTADDQTTASKKVDITQWHNYATEWTSTGIRGYVDGVLFFTDTKISHLPPRSMHQTVQLDWFPKGSSATTPSSMNVAWMRYYPA